MDGLFTVAVEEGPENKAVLAYDGSGRLFACCRGGLLRYSDVRPNFLSNTGMSNNSSEKLDTTRLPSRTLKLSTVPDFSVNTLSFSCGGRYALAVGPRSDGSERHGVAVIDVHNTTKSRDGTEVAPVFAAARQMFDNRPGLRPLQVAWHPTSGRHFGLLTSDNVWHLFDAKQPEQPEQSFELTTLRAQRHEWTGELGPRSRAEAFAFSRSSEGWDRFAVFFASTSGDVFLLCPIAPFGARYHRAAIQELLSASRGGRGERQTAEAWLLRAFPGAATQAEGSAFARLGVQPHSLENTCPALQGPLLWGDEGDPPEIASVRSMALLRWEALGQGTDPERDLSVHGCTALALSGAGGRVVTVLVAGTLQPKWEMAQPRRWTGDDGELLRTRCQALACTSTDKPLQLYPVDKMDMLGNVEDEADDDDSEGVEHLVLMEDPAAADRFFACSSKAVVGVSLPWMASVARALHRGESEEEALGPVSLPPARAVDMTDGQVSGRIAGACIVGDAAASALLAVVTADGDGRLLPVHSVMAAGPPSEPLSGQSEGAPEAAALAGDSVAAEAEAALQAQYAWLLRGPAERQKPAPRPGLGCNEIEGQKHLHAAIAGMDTQHVEFATQAHQFIRQKVKTLGAELKRQMEREAGLRSLSNKASAAERLLEDRVQRAQFLNENLQKRLSLLTEMMQSHPRPLSSAERAFKDQGLPLLENHLEGLREQVKCLSARTASVARGSSNISGGATKIPALQFRRIQDLVGNTNKTIADSKERAQRTADMIAKINLL